MKKGYEQAKNATNPLQSLEGGLNEVAGGINTAFSPLAAITEPTIGAGINYAADKISNVPAVQKFAQSKAGEVTERAAEDVGNVTTIAGTLAGAKGAGKVGTGAVRTAGEAVDKTAGYLGGAVKDIVPTSQGVINHQIAKALDLSPSDMSNISKSTGNEVGQWLSEHNLIGGNKEATQQLINDFKTTNYDAVRSEIAKVSKFYKQSQVPRFVDALKQIKKKVETVPGLEHTWAEVSNLLRKEELSLDDVQRVKELMDEHFKLYKVTGDVGEGVAKEGLSNIRKELRSFIEKEVKRETGADIKQMNNNVSTAKALDDAIITRAPKGLTSANIKTGDFATFFGGMSFGGPLTGIAALFVKKVMETPTVRLRVAKYLDEVSDAKKAKIQAALEAGEIPKEFDQFIKNRSSAVSGGVK